MRSHVGVFHLWGSLPFVGNQCWTQGDQQGEFVLDAMRCVWELIDRREAFVEVRNRFHMRRALDSVLPGLLPVVHSLLTESRLGIVMR